jgi:DNA-binding transcriptional LysR family regulator
VEVLNYWSLHNLWLSPAGIVNSSALAYFLVAYRHRSIGKACRELKLSQPALSKALRRLEDELHVPLFRRTPVGIEPTSYGDMLARRAKIVQNEIGRAVSEIETLRSHMGGEARIGVGPALAASLVSQALASFLKTRPQMVVHLQEGLYESLSDAVMTGRYDFAVTTRPSAPIVADLTATLLFKDRFVFAAGTKHPLAARKTVKPADLIQYPWVLPPRGGLLWPRIVDVFDRIGLRAPEPQVETNSSGCMIALLRSGTFISLVPTHLVDHDVRRREIVMFTVSKLDFNRDVIVLRRAESVLSPGSEAFLTHLIEFIQRKTRA